MRDVERRVLRLIIERSEPITARELAASAGVSERSVRTYVRSINEQAGVVCVESGRMGYWYRSDAARRLMECDRGDAVPVPQTNAERCTYVVNRLLHSPAPVSAAVGCSAGSAGAGEMTFIGMGSAAPAALA